MEPPKRTETQNIENQVIIESNTTTSTLTQEDRENAELIFKISWINKSLYYHL